MNICPSCRIGRLGKRSMVYIEWYGENLLVTNRMPAHVCDVCGERIYDDEAIENLQRLIWSKPLKAPSILSNRNG